MTFQRVRLIAVPTALRRSPAVAPDA